MEHVLYVKFERNNFYHFFLSHIPFLTNYYIFQGDSGDGLVSHGVIIGVASAIYGKCGSFPDEYTDVYEHMLEFIYPVLEE